MASKHMKELREKTDVELRSMILDVQKKMFTQRSSQAVKGSTTTSRREIARILMLLKEREREQSLKETLGQAT